MRCEIRQDQRLDSLEINLSIVVGVVHPEDVLLQFVSVRVGVALSHHAGKFFPAG